MRLMIFVAVAALALGACDQPEANQRTPADAAAPSSAAPAAGSSAASFDCTAARGQAQELICGDSTLAAMDREAARLAIADPAGQAAFAKQRDDCWKDDELRQCVMSSTMVRIHQLRSASPNEGPGMSIGPVAFRCAGIEGPLSATFVTSDPGAVALQWSGVTTAIDQVVAASGARYEGRWDGQPVSFWNKGREATLTLPGKGDLACSQIVEPR